jgi:hypothetical protein
MTSIIFAAIMLTLGSNFFTEAICQQFGNQTFCSGPAGTTTLQAVGNQAYIHHPDGQTSTYQQIGNRGYLHDANGGTSLYEQVGNSGYIQNPEGGTTTLQRIGDKTYLSGTNGDAAICRQKGNQMHCNVIAMYTFDSVE